MKVGVLAMMFACLLVVGIPLTSMAGPLPDMDSDTILDKDDNCKLVPQTIGVNDCDTDSDGYGNMCDCDYDQNNGCGGSDFALFRPQFGASVPPAAAELDQDCNLGVGGSDFALFRVVFGGQPGPSGLSCAGTVTCP
jgi:hypothetical protein